MKSRRIVRKKVEAIQPNKKIHREKIQKYSYVEVHWLDIVGDAGWQSFEVGYIPRIKVSLEYFLITV